MTWNTYIYVLRSEKFERNYTGFTTNIENRLKQHSSRKTKSTKPYKPLENFIFFNHTSTKEEALVREKYLKNGVGREFFKITYLAF